MHNLDAARLEAERVLSDAVNAYLGDGLTDAVMLVPAGNANRRYGQIMTGGAPDNIVIHETANSNPGADAIMHGRFLAGGGGADRVSFHAAADDKRTVQYLPWNEPCFAAGDGANGPGNKDSINIETCVNRDGIWSRTLANLARLVAKLMYKFHIPIGRVRQHNYYSSYGKDCPHKLRIGANWAAFLISVSDELAKLTNGGIPLIDRYFPETGVYLAAEFLAFFDRYGGIPIFGYPVRPANTAETADGKFIKIQYTERSRFEYHVDAPVNDRVKLGLIGVELLAETGQ